MVLKYLSLAFDTVNHTIMLNRLRDLAGMCCFTVSLNQIMSESAEQICGVPQGSMLGFILFLINIPSLGHIIQQFSDVFYHLFANDIKLGKEFAEQTLTSG